MMEFQLINKTCPSLLDLLISLEDHAYLPFVLKQKDDIGLFIISMKIPAEPLPFWIINSLDQNKDKLKKLIRTSCPPMTKGMKIYNVG
jgi:hypothetical protein